MSSRRLRLSEKKMGLPLLRYLAQNNRKDQSIWLNYMNTQGVDHVGEYVWNVAHSKIPMTVSTKKKLKQLFTDHHKDLRSISRKDIPVQKRKNAIVRQAKNGGCLNTVVKTSLPFVEKLVTKSLVKKSIAKPSKATLESKSTSSSNHGKKA